MTDRRVKTLIWMLVTAWLCIALLVSAVLDRHQEIRDLRAHLSACQEVVDGEYLLPLCNCGTREESIQRSCERGDYAHYEIMWNARHRFGAEE